MKNNRIYWALLFAISHFDHTPLGDFPQRVEVCSGVLRCAQVGSGGLRWAMACVACSIVPWTPASGVWFPNGCARLACQGRTLY